MNKRTEDKIEEIEKYLEELSEITPSNLEEYKRDFKARAACERYAEKIIEAIVDLAFLVVKEKMLSAPENDLQAFDILSKNKLISDEISEKLKDAKGMRNILAHEYSDVDDEIVFNSLKCELEEDTINFIKMVRKSLKEMK